MSCFITDVFTDKLWKTQLLHKKGKGTTNCGKTEELGEKLSREDMLEMIFQNEQD